MLGAIIGDIIGSTYEARNYRGKDFKLFTSTTTATDDTIMTLAVADCLQRGYAYQPDKIVETFKMWVRSYPDSGYGHQFAKWAFSESDEPYYSMGNGAAMRISPVGWYAETEAEVVDLARRLTVVTHNHPDGVKGAIVVAMCVFYARKGKSKDFIRNYVEKYYDLDFEYEDLRQNYGFDATCEGSIPQAIFCFLESKNYVDCIRNCVSIGGDCDTTAAIAGGIAEAYYKHIPEVVKEGALKFLKDEEPSPFDVINIFLDEFYDDFVKSEVITSKTIFLRVEEGSSVFIGHCKRLVPLKDYIILRLEEAICPKIKYIKNLLKKCLTFEELVDVIDEINDIAEDSDISFYLYKKK